MTDFTQPRHSPLLTPRQGFFYAALFTAIMVLCLALPRAMSFLPALIGTGGFVFYYARNKVMPDIDKKLIAFLGGFTALMCMSALWAPDAAYSFQKAAKSSAILFCCYALIAVCAKMPVLSLIQRQIIIGVSAFCCALSGVLIFSEYQTGFAICRFVLGISETDLPPSIKSGFLLNRSLVFVVLASLPVFLGIYTSGMKTALKYTLAALMIGGIGLALSGTKSQTSQIAVLFAAIMLFYPAHWKKARVFLMACVLAAMLAAPFFAGPAYTAFFETDTSKLDGGIVREASIPHRLEVWKFISEQIMEKPLIGHGIEATRFLHAGYIMPNMHTDNVLHPHNAVLQIWIEFGLVGILMAAGSVVFLLQRLNGLPPLLQRYYAMLFVVLLGVMTIGYGLWQAWQLGMVMAIPAYSILISRMNGIKD